MQVNVAKIKGLMAEHGDTQDVLAEKLGIVPAMLRSYLKGRTVMRVDTVAQIAEIYGIKPLDLLTIEQ